ncbi:hypothetical protein [Mucilaginibacter lacusdianchii]|uniref:hypothetical protein n=1 Tax=Mucilaginibacter lacusdianchii TaxID=2684211 RepID=UPI00131BB7D1|nr:hypothetical protein [Mucilaginibacter sp. JXJ CY 39]
MNKSLAVAITSPPTRPTLARAQQRAFALLFIFLLYPYSTKALTEHNRQKKSAFSFSGYHSQMYTHRQNIGKGAAERFIHLVVYL